MRWRGMDIMYSTYTWYYRKRWCAMCPLSLMGNYMDLIGDQSAEVNSFSPLHWCTDAKRRQKIFYFLPKLCMSSSWTTDIWSHCEAVHCLQSVGGHSSLALGRCKWPRIVNDPKITECLNPASVSWEDPQPFSTNPKMPVLWRGREYCWYTFGWMDWMAPAKNAPQCLFFVGGDILGVPCSRRSWAECKIKRCRALSWRLEAGGL